MTSDIAMDVLARCLKLGLAVTRTELPDGGVAVTTRDERGRLVSQVVLDARERLVRRVDVVVTASTYATTTTVRTQLPTPDGWIVTEAQEHEDARGRVRYEHTTSFRRDPEPAPWARRFRRPAARALRRDRAPAASRSAS